MKARRLRWPCTSWRGAPVDRDLGHQHVEAAIAGQSNIPQPQASVNRSQFPEYPLQTRELAAQSSALRVYVDACIAEHLEGRLDAVEAAKAKMLCTSCSAVRR